MSFTLEVTGQTNHSWTLSTNSLGQIARLRQTDAQHAIDIVFGVSGNRAGESRYVERAALVQAVQELIPLAKRLPGGFQVCVPPMYGAKRSSAGRGVAGVLIGGIYHYINCWEDYWTLQPLDETREGKEPIRHYEPVEIPTENMGTIKVEVKKSSQSELVKLLQDMRKTLENDQSDRVTVVWG